MPEIALWKTTTAKYCGQLFVVTFHGTWKKEKWNKIKDLKSYSCQRT
jgi:hypothetical protein